MWHWILFKSKQIDKTKRRKTSLFFYCFPILPMGSCIGTLSSPIGASLPPQLSTKKGGFIDFHFGNVLNFHVYHASFTIFFGVCPFTSSFLNVSYFACLTMLEGGKRHGKIKRAY